MKTTIVLSSVRETRIAGKILDKVLELLGTSDEITIVDPVDYPLPLLNNRYFEMKEPSELFQKLHKIFEESDGIIFITAEYNHSIPPALSNMLDHFGSEFLYKPAGIVSYSDGPIAGARAGEQLKLLVSTLGMLPIPISPAWGLAHKAGTPEGKSFEDNFVKNFNRFLVQYRWVGEAVRKQLAN